MQKPKSLEQIANELAAKREPIKMEPKPKNTGGIDLSRAAGAIKEQPKQQPKPNLAQKSRIPSQNLAQNSKIPSQNFTQKTMFCTESGGNIWIKRKSYNVCVING